MPCKICNKKTRKLINFGNFPVAHRFKKKNQKEKKSKLALSCCPKCNLVQLEKLFPLTDLRPRFEWINYNEPEEHLDKLVNIISKLKGINKNSVISGVSYKEHTTLGRLKKKGFKNIWSLDMKKDLDIKLKKFNLETIQDKISNANINKILKNKKKSDVLIARHILEHSYNTKDFIQSLKNLVNESGYIIFEVPDCSKALSDCDYTSIWEEHVLYFTENSLKKLLIDQGLNISYFEIYKYSYENIMIIITKIKKSKNIKKIHKKKTPININWKNLKKDRFLVRNKIQKYRKENYKICLFGTGHSAFTYLNLTKIHDLIDIVIDDDKHKKNYYLPNSNLKIQNSSVLKKFTKLCLILGVNSESEKKILLRLKKIKSKLVLYSVYKRSKYSF